MAWEEHQSRVLAKEGEQTVIFAFPEVVAMAAAVPWMAAVLSQNH